MTFYIFSRGKGVGSINLYQPVIEYPANIFLKNKGEILHFLINKSILQEMLKDIQN